MLFELQGELVIDPNKTTILFFDKGDQTAYTYIYGAARAIKDELQKHYNVITIGTGCKLPYNYYKVNRGKTSTLLRKVDSPEDYIDKNTAVIEKWMDESFKDLPEIEYIILGTDDFFRLPLTSYVRKSVSSQLCDMQNEFFDYIGDDKELIDKINEANKDTLKNWGKKVSPLAFSTKDYSLMMGAILHIHKRGKLKKNVISFSVDPAIYTPFFHLNNIPSKFYYFAEDKRGTRNFEQLDISQLQHIVYGRRFDNKIDDWGETTPSKNDNHDKNMFFAGTIFQEKGSRVKIWDEFLDGVKSEDCSYYIPLRKNGIIMNPNGPNDRQINFLEERFKELYDKVRSHKNFKGGLTPEQLHKEQRQYKYGMIFRCVSINDSLNMRPVLYAYEGILPLLDYQYDPAYLQIPKHIQDRIVVHSAEEIDERIKYFNENDNERMNVLNELRELFRIDEYINNPDEMLKEQIMKIIPDFNPKC